jgi:hypothetical protein
MRDYEVVVPSDTIASHTRERNERALDHLRVALGMKTSLSRTLRLRRSARTDA